MDSLIRGCNVYVGEINQHLRLASFKLPVLKREMLDFFLGGGFFKLSMPGEVSPLESEMEVNGSYGDLNTRFGREPGDWTTVTYYESLLNATVKTGGPARKGRVTMMKGLLNELTPPSVEGAKAKDKTKVKWSSIVLYHDIMDGVTIHKFDAFNNVLVINSVNYTADHNQLLAI